MNHEEDLADFDESETTTTTTTTAEVASKTSSNSTVDGNASKSQKGHVSINSSGFRDFLLKPEILRAIVDCSFEHPSEVQHECIPQAVLGNDILCQAKSGMGKTAVFVISTLQQIQTEEQQTKCLILCHTRELAFQICNEFSRFSKYLPEVNVKVFYGGIPITTQIQQLKQETPHIIVGTPGRVAQLLNERKLDFSHVKHFIIDECDKVLQSQDMREDVQNIFKKCPRNKQVMMFSATLSKDIRDRAKKFMNSPAEIYVDHESKLRLHGLQQYYISLRESEKNRKLIDILDALEFNQVVIFVRTIERANKLYELLNSKGFPCLTVHRELSQEERIKRYKQFKEFQKRIMIATDLLGRGIDIQRVNIVINYDMPDETDTYLHRVGRAGRFGTKGLAISFISSDMPKQLGTRYSRETTDDDVLAAIQKRFELKMQEMPKQIDSGSYMTS